MLRELLISSPLLLAGAFALYYFHNSNISNEPAQPLPSARPTETEQDELIRQILQEIENEEQEEGDEFDNDDDIDEEENGLREEFRQLHNEATDGLNAADLPEEFRRRINPTPAQLAAANAASNAAGSGSSSSSSRRNRTVGAKKSKSLARKDRIRAYNEYMRQEAEAERLRQEEYDTVYGDLIAEAKRDREQREASAEAQIQRRRAEKKEKEEQTKQELAETKEKLQNALTANGFSKLRNNIERELAKEIKNATIVADGEWVVLIDDKLENKIASSIKASGRISFSDLSRGM